VQHSLFAHTCEFRGQYTKLPAQALAHEISHEAAKMPLLGPPSAGMTRWALVRLPLPSRAISPWSTAT